MTKSDEAAVQEVLKEGPPWSVLMLAVFATAPNVSSFNRLKSCFPLIYDRYMKEVS